MDTHCSALRFKGKGRGLQPASTSAFQERPCRMNPKGIPSQSPGLRGTRYPGNTREEIRNPNGVAAVFIRAPTEHLMATTALRLLLFAER
jgi:hypothetical protein